MIKNVKNDNKLAILDMIRFSPGGISRAEIARQMGLSRSAITSIVHDLLEVGVVREADNSPTSVGRRPIMLEIDPQRGFLVGVDLGAVHLGLLLTDFSAHVIHEIEVPFDIKSGPQVCLEDVDTRFRELLDDAGVAISEVLAIGVGVPGPVVTEAGSVIAPPIMPGWDHFPIQSHLQSLWDSPVSLNNDAELGVLGEWSYGAGRGENHLVYIKVGSGIGAGLLLDGEIYCGATGTAGEIGHMTVKEEGPLCTCGNRGCLEALAGGKAIAEQAKQAVLSGERTLLSMITPLEGITTKDVGEAARRGDLVAQGIVANAGNLLGIAIANLVNLFNPSVVIVGGAVAQMGDLLLEPIRQTVEDCSLRAAFQAVRITAAVLGHRSTSMGAVVQAATISLSKLMKPMQMNERR